MIKTNILWCKAFSTIPAKILAPFHWSQFHRQLCHYDQPFYDQNLANKLRTVFGIRQLFGSKDQASIEPMRQFAGYDPNHQSSGLELFWKKNQKYNTFIMLELFLTKYIQCNVMDYGQHKDEKFLKNKKKLSWAKTRQVTWIIMATALSNKDENHIKFVNYGAKISQIVHLQKSFHS